MSADTGVLLKNNAKEITEAVYHPSHRIHMRRHGAENAL